MTVQVLKIGDMTVAELNSARIEFDVVGPDGAVPTANVDSFTVTIFDDLTEEILNSRDAVDIFNTGGNTYSDGHVVFAFDAEDNPIFDTSLPRGAKEAHTARFTLIWDGGLARWDGEVKIKVINMSLVP